MKRSYHHGELRQALIDAARQLISERNGNDFSLSDACRLAGVSTAAPYRHFADKNEIVTEVVAAQTFYVAEDYHRSESRPWAVSM